VAFGVDANDSFAEVEVSGKLEEIGNGTVAYFRDVAAERKRVGEEEKNCGDKNRMLPSNQPMSDVGQTIHWGR